jgi:hypothetical protein
MDAGDYNSLEANKMQKKMDAQPGGSREIKLTRLRTALTF